MGRQAPRGIWARCHLDRPNREAGGVSLLGGNRGRRRDEPDQATPNSRRQPCGQTHTRDRRSSTNHIGKRTGLTWLKECTGETGGAPKRGLLRRRRPETSARGSAPSKDCLLQDVIQGQGSLHASRELSRKPSDVLELHSSFYELPLESHTTKQSVVVA
jgi:hypothetical protein